MFGIYSLFHPQFIISTFSDENEKEKVAGRYAAGDDHYLVYLLSKLFKI